MRFINFSDANCEFGKPSDMTDEECSPVSGFKGELPSGTPFVLVALVPNREDLESLNAGNPLFIQWLGGGLPPSSVFTVNENGESNNA